MAMASLSKPAARPTAPGTGYRLATYRGRWQADAQGGVIDAFDAQQPGAELAKTRQAQTHASHRTMVH